MECGKEFENQLIFHASPYSSPLQCDFADAPTEVGTLLYPLK